jgi:hypothetical protein
MSCEGLQRVFRCLPAKKSASNNQNGYSTGYLPAQLALTVHCEAAPRQRAARDHEAAADRAGSRWNGNDREGLLVAEPGWQGEYGLITRTKGELAVRGAWRRNARHGSVSGTGSTFTGMRQISAGKAR